MMTNTEKKLYAQPTLGILSVGQNSFLEVSGDITAPDSFNDNFGKSF